VCGVIVGDTLLYPKANVGSDKAHLAWHAIYMVLQKIGTRSVKGILRMNNCMEYFEKMNQEIALVLS